MGKYFCSTGHLKNPKLYFIGKFKYTARWVEIVSINTIKYTFDPFSRACEHYYVCGRFLLFLKRYRLKN